MEDIRWENLRIQIQRTGFDQDKKFTDDCSTEEGKKIGRDDFTLLNQAEDNSLKLTSGMIGDGQEEEPMDVDLDVPVSESSHQVVPSESPASGQDSNRYRNHYFEGRKTRRYHNPYLTSDLDPNKLSSRASRFSNDDGVNNVEFNPEKLGSRAQRFGLQKEKQDSLELPTDEKLLDLYFSVALIPDVGGKLSLDQVDPKSRLDSILIRGTNNMSTNEIFKYLHDNNVHPLEMEWINDACCIVIYKDNYDAAATLLNITKPILVEPPRRKFIDGDEGEEEGEISEEEDKVYYHETDVVSSRLIKVPMPLGYVWRFAVPCEKATGILMRYANVNDRKQEKSERHSVYYKKHGLPKYRNAHTFSTASTMAATTRTVTLSSIDSEKILPATPTENKYAWSDLSAAWSEQERAEEMSKKGFKISLKPSHGGAQIVSPIKSFKIQVNFTNTSSSKKSKCKRKRDQESKDEIDLRSVLSDRRQYNRQPTGHEGSDDDSGDGVDWKKEIRGPVMRKHVDAEERGWKSSSKKFKKVASSSFSSVSNTNDWMAIRTVEFESDCRRGIKDRLGGFHAVSHRNPPEKKFELDYCESGGFRRTKVKRSVAERLRRKPTYFS